MTPRYEYRPEPYREATCYVTWAVVALVWALVAGLWAVRYDACREGSPDPGVAWCLTRGG